MVNLTVQQPLWHREWKGAEFCCISDWVLGSPILPLQLCLFSGLPKPGFPLFSQGHGCYLLSSLFVSLHLLYSTNRPYSLSVCTSSTPMDKIQSAWSLSPLDTMFAFERTLEAVLRMISHCYEEAHSWVRECGYIYNGKNHLGRFLQQKVVNMATSSEWG